MSDLARAEHYRRQAKFLRDAVCLSPAAANSEDLVAAALHLESLANEIEKAAKPMD